MPTVAELLAASRAAHEAYRMAKPRLDRAGQVVPGNAAAAAVALQQAYDRRADAEALDVAGTETGWTDGELTHPHYALLIFYDQQTREPNADQTHV